MFILAPLVTIPEIEIGTSLKKKKKTPQTKPLKIQIIGINFK